MSNVIYTGSIRNALELLADYDGNVLLTSCPDVDDRATIDSVAGGSVLHAAEARWGGCFDIWGITVTKQDIGGHEVLVAVFDHTIESD